MTAIVVRGDALSLPLRDNSVDLVCTSPPYLWKRKYAIDGAGEMGNEANWRLFLDNLWAATDEMLRVLKTTGSIWVNLGDTRVTGTEPKWLGIPVKSKLLLPERYRIGCQDRYAARGVIVRQVQILEKLNGLPESVDDRTRDSHEDWVHIVKRRDYYSAVDEIRLPSSGYRRTNSASRATPNGQRPRAMADSVNLLGALPGSVWRMASEPLRLPSWVKVDHYAAFSTEVVRQILLGWSPHLICGVCKVGRFPVVDKGGPDPELLARRGLAKDDWHNGNGPRGKRDHYNISGKEWAERAPATILGYACGCTPFTTHPGTGETSGQGWIGREDNEGRYPSNGLPGGAIWNRPKVGPWREYHLSGWTPPPGHPPIVLDPFGGTGTVAHVAHALGRHAITIDLSAAYCRLAADATLARQRAGKVAGQVNLERQGSLL